MREFRAEIRWTIVAVVLTGLAIYALWPREPGSESDGSVAPVASAPASADQRAAADLEPCPAGPGSGPTELAGVSGICESDGSRVDLGAAVAGQPTLINVWATWCVPCRTELPALQKYAQRPDSVRVLGVQVRSPESDGLDLLADLGVHFPVVHDRDNQIQQALRVPNVMPTSYLVTADGQVRRIEPPVAFESAQEVDDAVRRTLAGSDPAGDSGSAGG